MSAQVTNWRKSTRSANNSACVEVGSSSSVVAVRDTKARAFATLAVDHSEWRGFLASFVK